MRGTSALLAALIAPFAAAACATHAAAVVYLLPFPAGARHVLIQGVNGRFGHAGAAAYAYDFQSEIGSPVTAARAGVVVALVEANPDAAPRHPEPGHENLIVIDHGDGSFGRYYHLTQNGAEVELGARVRAGQAIARSGNSGASFGPHLHFDVTRGCYEWGCQTVAFRFAGLAEEPLVEQHAYAR